MSIKLNAQSGGSVALDAPTQTTSSADLTFKLPVADGSTGQFIKTDGSGNLAFATVSTTPASGELIETIVGQCDGRTIAGASGNYTLQNVTAHQSTTDTFTDLTGSSITYTPPTGTKKVVFTFSCYHEATSLSAINYMRLMVDGTEVTQGREIQAYDYNSYRHSVQRLDLTYTFITDATSQDVANGKFTSWTSGKTLKYQARRHGSSYTGNFHALKYWASGADGTGGGNVTSEVKIPMLRIESFA